MGAGGIGGASAGSAGAAGGRANTASWPGATADAADVGRADVIILAFNPTGLGDLQASLLTKELAPLTKKISRLGRGLPTGGEIEFADDETLGSALERRS